METLIAPVEQALKSPQVGEALSGVFGSVSLTAWICLLVSLYEDPVSYQKYKVVVLNSLC